MPWPNGTKPWTRVSRNCPRHNCFVQVRPGGWSSTLAGEPPVGVRGSSPCGHWDISDTRLIVFWAVTALLTTDTLFTWGRKTAPIHQTRARPGIEGKKRNETTSHRNPDLGVPTFEYGLRLQGIHENGVPPAYRMFQNPGGWTCLSVLFFEGGKEPCFLLWGKRRTGGRLRRPKARNPCKGLRPPIDLTLDETAH